MRPETSTTTFRSALKIAHLQLEQESQAARQQHGASMPPLVNQSPACRLECDEPSRHTLVTNKGEWETYSFEVVLADADRVVFGSPGSAHISSNPLGKKRLVGLQSYTIMSLRVVQSEQLHTLVCSASLFLQLKRS